MSISYEQYTERQHKGVPLFSVRGNYLLESILQTEFKSGKNIINLPSGEFKESIVIDRPCSIIGNNTTLWNENIPVLLVRSSGVTLKNLNLQLTDISGYESEHAILQLQSDTIVENVEIYGGVDGTKKFYMPRAVHLGEFKANEVNTFIISMYLPEKCKISVKSLNFKAYYTDLGNGHIDLTIETNPLSDGSMLYGEIIVTSNLIRKIFVDGTSLESVPKQLDKILYSYEEPPQNTVSDVSIMTFTKPKISTNNRTLQTKTIQRGERYPLDFTNLTMKLSYSNTSYDVDIDPYIFLVNENNITNSNADMIFFGNRRYYNNSVVINDDNTVNVQLDKVPFNIKKVCVCYAVYNSINHRYKNFSMVSNLKFSIFSGKYELFKIPLDRLESFSAVILIEFYRHNGIWKVNPVVAGYRGNLPQMCQSFGIDAEY